MNKVSNDLRLALLAAGLLFGACAGAQLQPVSCNSQGAIQRACPADTFFGVVLVREVKPGKCIYGKTWHFDREGIYVSKDCSAEFLVHPRRTDPRSKDGYEVQGTGVDAFHTNGAVRPGQGSVEPDATDKPKATTNNPK